MRSCALVLGLAFVAFSSACTADDSVDLIISTGGLDAVSETSLEVRVSTGACPALDDVILGDPSVPVAADVYHDFGATNDTLASVGVLEDRDYSFLAIIRDTSCRPVRYGCVVANPARSSPVTVTTAPVGVELSPYCHARAACSASLCVSGDDATACDEREDGSSCESTDGTAGVCCAGSCLLDVPDDRCSSPPPPCDGGPCTPPTTESITITVTGDATRPDGSSADRLQAALAWRIIEASDPDFGAFAETVAVTDAVDVAFSDASLEVSLPVSSVPPPALEGSSSFGLDAIAVAALVVAAPTTADGQLSLEDVHRVAGGVELPSPYGASLDTVVIYSEYPVGPDITGGGGFPDGISAGVHVYARDLSTGSYRSSVNPSTEVTLCALEPGSDQQSECVWGRAP